MTPEQQSAVKAAAEEAVEYEAGLVEQQMQETMDFLNENMTYVEVDVKSIQDKLGKDFYQELDAAGALWPTGPWMRSWPSRTAILRNKSGITASFCHSCGRILVVKAMPL